MNVHARTGLKYSKICSISGITARFLRILRIISEKMVFDPIITDPNPVLPGRIVSILYMRERLIVVDCLIY
jgi:hypothetical protein